MASNLLENYCKDCTFAPMADVSIWYHIWLLGFGWQRYTTKIVGMLDACIKHQINTRSENKTDSWVHHILVYGVSRMYTCSVNMYFQCSSHVWIWQTCFRIQNSLLESRTLTETRFALNVFTTKVVEWPNIWSPSNTKPYFHPSWWWFPPCSLSFRISKS